MHESCWKLLIIWYSGSKAKKKTDAMMAAPTVQQLQAAQPALLPLIFLLKLFSITMKRSAQTCRQQ
jgi:hypothetical protein